MAKYGLNQVTLIGNLGRDPELKYTDKGVAVCSISLACTESYRDANGNNVDRTNWINVVLWRSQAEILGKYCRKGSTVCIEGRITTRSYTTAENETRYVTEVEGRKLILLDSRPQSGGTMAQPVQQQVNTPTTSTAPSNTPAAESTPQAPLGSSTKEEDSDDLPF
ncbi:MAG: single-stranded DNA-binding protein [Bacteroidota bacterium]